jgi:hypothetical protein
MRKKKLTPTQATIKDALQIFDPNAKAKGGKPAQKKPGISDAEFKLRVVLALEEIAKTSSRKE